MKNYFKLILVTLVTSVLSFPYPISQPGYGNNQVLSVNVLPHVQYKQPEAQGYIQPQYVRQQVVQPAYESRNREGLNSYTIQTQPTDDAAERQVSYKQYRPQLQIEYIPPSQLASQARESFASAQKKQSQNQQPQAQQYVVEQPQVAYITKQSAVKQRPQKIKYNQAEQQETRKEEDYDPNPSYQFGFDVRDDLYTNYQNRKEQREGNKITGSYSVVDSDGFIRTVSYTADPKEGFKAEVSREPTDIVVKIPKPLPQYQSTHHKQRQQYVQEVPNKRNPNADRQKQPNIVYQYQ